MSRFLAIIVGMAMMLGYTTSHHGNELEHLLAHQRLGDRATVERALDSIDPRSDLHGSVVAVQSATLKGPSRYRGSCRAAQSPRKPIIRNGIQSKRLTLYSNYASAVS